MNNMQMLVMRIQKTIFLADCSTCQQMLDGYVVPGGCMGPTPAVTGLERELRSGVGITGIA